MANQDAVKALKNVISAIESVDKPMLQSRKFIAFMFIQACWTALIAYGINFDLNTSTMNMMVGALGTAQTTFLGVQGWHDRHVKPAKITAMNGSVHKSLTERSDEA